MRLQLLILQTMLSMGLSLAAPTQAAELNVLWYTYADPASWYRQTISELAGVVQTLPKSNGSSWRLTYFGPQSATPNFAAFDVLVIESGEAYLTGPSGGEAGPDAPDATPDYSGILSNRSAIAAARGDRTFVSGADADFHAVRGDTGNAPYRCDPVIDSACWDGALGHLVNAVNWAADGNGLGVVSFLDGEFPGSFWWENRNSFLREELSGAVRYAGGGTNAENNPIIDTQAANHPLNFGLTSTGLSNWNYSFHAFFPDSIPNYSQIVDSSRRPDSAVAIASSSFAVPIPAAAWLLGSGLIGLIGIGKRKR